MRTVIDISEPRFEYAGLPDPTLILDDGDVVITLGEVELRMNYGQFDRLRAGINKWCDSIPSEDDGDLRAMTADPDDDE